MTLQGDMDLHPLVSIACITYNHEKYIRQCLDGFVMQRVNFKYEIVIHDDASTDNTATIIREYCEKYPHLFVPILQKQNKYVEGKGILAPYVYPHCQGKYIALCEGDDYWIDPYKLQKQVDFLEGHPEYSMCFHKAKTLYDDQPEKVSRLFDSIKDRDYTIDELFLDWIVPTASILYRREFTTAIKQDCNFMFGDGILVLSMASCGKVHALGDTMSVYRRTKTGAILSMTKSEAFYERLFKNLQAFRTNFPLLSDNAYMQKYTERCMGYMLYLLKKGDLSSIFQVLFEEKYFKWKYAFILMCKYLINVLCFKKE